MVELSPRLCHTSYGFLLRGVLIPDDPEVISPVIRDAIAEGRFERDEADAVPGIVREDDVVLEIGAGIGFMSTLLSREQAVRRVIAVEANPRLMAYMAGLHRENAVEKVERINAVLSNDDRRSATFYLRRDFWTGSLMPGPNPYLGTVAVPTLSFDRLIAENAVSLIVCDVEGAEAFLFEGADLSGVDRVFLELHDHITGLKGIAALFRALMQAGLAYDPRHSCGSVVLFQRVRPDEALRPYAG